MTPEEIRRKQEAEAMWGEVIKKKSGSIHREESRQEERQPEQNSSGAFEAIKNVFAIMGVMAFCAYLYAQYPEVRECVNTIFTFLNRFKL